MHQPAGRRRTYRRRGPVPLRTVGAVYDRMILVGLLGSVRS